MAPLLEVVDLHTSYPIRSGLLRRVRGEVEAVAGVNLTLDRGETLGVVGESGCGKTSLARSIVGLTRAQQGRIMFDGTDLRTLTTKELAPLRREIQMVFQDPYSSLNPRMTVGQVVGAPWRIHPDVVEPDRRSAELGRLLELVGLDPSDADKYPHQFSGGQRQRIGIARALALRPRLLVCDEPVSALDVSIQAQVVNLLEDLQTELGLAYLFIAHDLAVVRHICHRVAVMYLGRIVEIGNRADVYDRPTHPYTQALLSAIPSPEPWEATDRHRIVLEGDVPNPAEPPSGCRFRTRCWKAEARCAEEEPALEDRLDHGHPSACHFAEVDEYVAG